MSKLTIFIALLVLALVFFMPDVVVQGVNFVHGGLVAAYEALASYSNGVPQVMNTTVNGTV